MTNIGYMGVRIHYYILCDFYLRSNTIIDPIFVGETCKGESIHRIQRLEMLI
ncbi:hypothetical protein CY34DRAFT_813126 [Suillus luteus UH-Slu-Lm8-n1]|uniref:Uncharacterized protein n=1 Tax=Suillus luteus UH-Slu-Lm8-n1 TaxID=930992 RepID=A0A0D0AQ58_9AGAM|nr:hypothetical protein CY34DRAFT_813126 [Suillus luteus UH-Slu-Lm8-n1]